MQIVTVSPIVRGIPRESLTYFSKEPLSVGMVVRVPVRTREIPAIVIETKMASAEKGSLKSSDYTIRKILKTPPQKIWSPAFLTAVEYTANMCAQKFGETLLTLIPKTVLEAYLEGELTPPTFSKKTTVPELLAIQGDTSTRTESYRQLIRESFAHNESVFICVPTEEDGVRIAKELGRGIEDYTFLFHSSITSKKTRGQWQKVLTEKHAILVVGTAQYLSIPRFFKTIILGEEQARSWKTMMPPLIDLRVFVEAHAKASGSILLFGAPLLRTETMVRLQGKEIEYLGSSTVHHTSLGTSSIVDPRKEEKSIREETGRREFVILTQGVQELIMEAQAKHERIFLLASRKGLAPITSCGDCGTLVRCPTCTAPLVIHKKEIRGQQSQVFVCHTCGFMRTPEDNVHEVCTQCGGWKLQGVGIGIDRIEAEVASLFPNVPLFILDGDRAKTHPQAKKIVAEFEQSRGGILLATPMAIPFLPMVGNSVVISLDSLFAIPDVRISERIFTLILALREKTTGVLMVQTRADDITLFEQALRGDLLSFSENERMLRKMFSYPPYGTIIKITLRAPQDTIASEMEHLKTFLSEFTPIVTGTIAREPTRIGNKTKKLFRMHMILKLGEKQWPNTTLLTKLRTLPPQFTIEVDPDHLL